ncbi:putative MFS family arabinose efflux permease [Paenibacillus sp. BK033]|uniref:staphylopine family metallophore export MFS transporter CntE n=1 Tax=Paenibacillus sp. BK033 TaxID=2512133 RepID=UPI00104A5FA6|nr:MFS transporter [Paenibacillus sp. BK033]TCM99430.1 putative MFS family arabinose efflux permease [Paenibacillus sp. BK033]
MSVSTDSEKSETSAALARNHPFGLKAIQIYSMAVLFYTTSHILLILLPLSSQKLGASPAQIGFIMGAYMFTSMFLRPVAGKIVDTLGTKRIFIATLIMNAVVLSLYSIQELWLFAGLRILQGVILSFFSMISHLMIIEALPEDARGQGLSLFSLSSMLPYTYGPFLVLYFIDKIPTIFLFVALIPLGLITLLIGANARMPELRKNDHPQAAKATNEKYSGWSDRKLLFPSFIMLLASAVIGTISAFLPIYLEIRGLPYASLYFLTETAVLVFLRFFGRKFIPTGKRFPYKLVVLLICMMTAAVGLLRIADSLTVVLFAAVCNGIALSMLYPTLLTYVSFTVPERFKGQGIGLFIAAADFGTSVGIWALSLLANAFTYEMMFSSCVGIGGAALLLLICYRRWGGRI